jgi:ABC-2 type transport system permease protein
MTTTNTRLLGFRTFLHKELQEWFRRPAVITFVVMVALGTLGTLAARIDEAGGGEPPPEMLNATASILGSQFQQWVLMAAIFASIGMLATERLTGTLAWTLSKPISRRSVLLAKWTVGVTMVTLFGIVLPLAWMAVLATLVYGGAPDLLVVARFGLALATIPAFLVALDLALATRLDSQAGIAAIAIFVAFAPSLLEAFAPGLAQAWPTAIGRIAATFALGGTANSLSLVGWAAAIAILGRVGLWTFEREDL